MNATIDARNSRKYILGYRDGEPGPGEAFKGTERRDRDYKWSGWNRELNGEARSRTVPEEDIESFEELVIVNSLYSDLDPSERDVTKQMKRTGLVSGH